jgi:hypothetical protein
MIDKLKKNKVGYNRQNNYTDIDLDLSSITERKTISQLQFF